MWTWERLTWPLHPKLNLPPMLNPPPVLAFNAMGDVATPWLNNGTMQSHHSLGAITTPPGSLTSHKHHSIGTMAIVGVFCSPLSLCSIGFYMLSRFLMLSTIALRTRVTPPCSMLP